MQTIDSQLVNRTEDDSRFVYIKLAARARGIAIAGERGQPLALTKGEVDLVLTRLDEDEPESAVSAILRTETPLTLTQLLDAQWETFERSNAEWKHRREEQAGRMIGLPLHPDLLDPPARLSQFFDPTFGELRDVASRVVQLLRWLYNLLGSASPLTDIVYTWGYKEDEWRPLPWLVTSDIGVIGDEAVRDLTESGVEIFQAMIEDDRFSEPFARQLLLEAIQLEEANPRASVVLAVAAAEVGLKRFAGGDDPSQMWLLSEMPSPPVMTLIRNYLPFLTDKRTRDGSVIPKPIRRVLTEAVELRATLFTEGWTLPLQRDSPRFSKLSTFLYTLDWLQGSTWALSRVRRSTRNEFVKEEDSPGG
jgi:hypothetical protein